MNGETWVKAVASGIRKMKVINVACVLSNLLLYIYIYITIHLCTYKLSSDDM